MLILVPKSLLPLHTACQVTVLLQPAASLCPKAQAANSVVDLPNAKNAAHLANPLGVCNNADAQSGVADLRNLLNLHCKRKRQQHANNSIPDSAAKELLRKCAFTI
jgi:hypothetical protein